MSRDKQIEEMAEMLEIIREARETYANDITDHTENEYIREGLLNGNYRKASEVAREIFNTLRVLGHIDFDGNICIRKDSFEELKKKYTESEDTE